MAHHAFCCVHPQSRIDSPEPPSRPPVNIDSIFAAAALPQDHPHALDLPVTKPDVPSKIIRSPSVARKITSQFRRCKSLKVLRSEEYDGDMKALGSREIVEQTGSYDEADVDAEDGGEMGEVQCEEGVITGDKAARHIAVATTDQVVVDKQGDGPRASMLRSLEWIEPLIERPHNSTPCSPYERARNAEVVALQDSQIVERPSKGMQQSPSSPSLTKGLDPHVTGLGRMRSYSQVGASLSPPGSSADASTQAMHQTTEQPPCQVKTCNDRAGENQVHLIDLNISKQLRSLSAVSDTDADGNSLTENDIWAFHTREKPEIGGLTGASRHLRLHSKANSHSYDPYVIDGGARSPAPSSVYSRPSTTVEDCCVRRSLGNVPQAQYPLSLDGTILDWPLAPDASHTLPMVIKDADNDQETSPIRADELLPISPINRNPESTSSAGTVATQNNSSGALLSPFNPTSLPPRKPSSSQLTTSTKRSRFFERFSPPKKSVKKRHSIFRFLRPGSRTRQIRSISSPVLVNHEQRLVNGFDGPSDEPEIITVQYELADRHAYPRTDRAASTNHLPVHDNHAEENLAAPPLLSRRSSFADYELTLTAVGDDRRRPSNVNLHILTEAAEGDRRQSLQHHRKLTRARSLEDDSTNLMAQALAKHQHEKANFQSPSKHRETMASSNAADLQVPTLHVDSSSAGSSGFIPSLASGHSGFFGMNDTLPTGGAASRTQSTTLIAPPPSPASAQRHSLTNPHLVPPLQHHTEDVKLHSSPQPAAKIESALTSWCRYPSHTRAERCGSAGPQDAVFTRDFATSPIHEPEGAKLNTEPVETTSSDRSMSKARRLIKSGSTIFSDIARYYSNIFSGSSAAQNRRSSIVTGGWLTHPDLELLPASSPHEPILMDHDPSIEEQLQKIEQGVEEKMRKAIEYVDGKIQELEQDFVQDVEDLETTAENFPSLHVDNAEALTLAEAPFSVGNPFALDAKPSRPVRTSTFIDPADETDHGLRIIAPTGHVKPDSGTSNLKLHSILDGAEDGLEGPDVKSPAEKWSSVYADCLTLAPSTTSEKPRKANIPTNNSSTAMAPPSLKPPKTRSPNKLACLAPEARVRRFPSVTVVDDCKGHSRSVSLISVKYRGDGILRASTNDLLQLIEAREGEEREKLLQGASRTSIALKRDGFAERA